MTWTIAHPWWGSNPRSLDYIPSSVNSHHVSDHQSNASLIDFYISGALNQEIVYGNDKNMNCRCPMAAILNFTICGKTVPFTAWHTAEIDSAQKMHIETTSEVLFLKNAYGSLSRAISKFFVLSMWGKTTAYDKLHNKIHVVVNKTWMWDKMTKSKYYEYNQFVLNGINFMQR